MRKYKWRQSIQELGDEAAERQDTERRLLCDKALNGDCDAFAECVNIILDNDAQEWDDFQHGGGLSNRT